MPKTPPLWACACGWTGTASQLLQGPYDRVCPACGASGGLILQKRCEHAWQWPTSAKGSPRCSICGILAYQTTYLPD